ncbi:SAG-related sequence SRS18 [Toxoplasma gondii ARI]|uniref:SAG-related sequence SRS18 n=2 Tax=Toxoplasma gondii TaxID=5811 RepID=A0A2G8XVX5_TOXGO|nr:SAG-related sequence SRS18 [Toxoplasma gondii ARI]PIL99141.1 SAG-related sequence SRS18 [Toxoplasma gondii COUG]
MHAREFAWCRAASSCVTLNSTDFLFFSTMKSPREPSQKLLPCRRSRVTSISLLFLVFAVHSVFLSNCRAQDDGEGSVVYSDTGTVCDVAAATKLVIVEKPGTVKFKCGANLPTLYPAQNSADQTVCDYPNCRTPVKLADMFDGASLTKETVSEGVEYSFTTSKWPDSAGSIFFSCKPNPPTPPSALRQAEEDPQSTTSAADACTVRIVIRDKPEKEIPSYECSTPTGQRFFRVDSSGDAVSFSCGAEMALETQTHAYQTAECTDLTPLTTLLPSASLTQDTSQSGTLENPLYTLTVPQLPGEPINQLCFLCKSKESSSSTPDVCKVLIGFETLPNDGEPQSQEATSASFLSLVLLALTFGVSTVAAFV